jgi:DNA (cytosine-5)-methyltransferase 1
LWRTPDTGGGGTSGLLKQGKNHRENGQPIQIRLVDQVNNPRLWPTITINGNYNRKGLSKTSGDGLATVVGGPLNPPWVEWLMGWPLGWTDLKPLEMDKFQKWRQQHGNYSVKEFND